MKWRWEIAEHRLNPYDLHTQRLKIFKVSSLNHEIFEKAGISTQNLENH